MEMTLPTYFSKVPNQDRNDSESHETTIDLDNDKICANEKSRP